MGPVEFYFDFISPYSYLASALIARRPELASLPLRYRPVVFGTMLSRLGKVGPGEVPETRRSGLADVLMLAAHYGVPLEGPPAHPFNSIYALRSVAAIDDEVLRGRLVHAYFAKAWGEGQSLESLPVLSSCLAELGIEQDPEEAASAPENRRRLKASTEEALGRGARGVPTFAVGDVLFFGHDRLELLRAFVEGRVTLSREKLERLLARPRPGRVQ